MTSPLTPDQIHKYSSRLLGLRLWPGLPRRWQQNRAIQKLAQDGSSAAARELALSVAHLVPSDPVVQQNLITALKSMREDYQLKEIAEIAIDNDRHDDARREHTERLLPLIKQANYLPFEPPNLRVFVALACEWPERLADDGPEVVQPLLKAYEIFSDRREVALSAIRALRAQGTIDTLCRHWMESGSAGDDLASMLISAGHSPSEPVERALFWLLIGQIQRYEELDHDGTLLIQAQAINRICRHWMETGAAGDDLATLLLSAGHSPSEPAERALFWLLIGQIQRYEELDLDGLLLVQAHVSGSAKVRKRLAAEAAAAGRMEWLEAMQQCKRLDQFDATDWDSTIQILEGAADPHSIWQWALKASPLHAQKLLRALPSSPSQPTGIPEEALGLQSLAIQLSVPDRHYFILCIHTLSGHDDRVRSIAWSPDGHCLASGSSDNTIRLWDPISGACIHTLLGHSETVWSIAWSPDGSCLASGSEDKTIRLWDPATGACTHTLAGHTGGVYSIAWSPNGRCLASGGRDKKISLWDPATGACNYTLSGRDSKVFTIAWSPDGRCLGSGGEDKKIRLWDPATGECTHTLAGHTGGVYKIAWSPDGLCLASGSSDHTIKLWDPMSGACTHTLSGHSGSVMSIAWWPYGHCLATGSLDNTIRLWDPTSGAWTHTLSGETVSVWSIAWSPDGSCLASSSFDNTILVWANEFFSLLTMPLACYGEKQWKLLSTLQHESKQDWQRPWLEFIDALGGVIRRFDVTVDDGATQPTASPFEVEIDG